MRGDAYRMRMRCVGHRNPHSNRAHAWHSALNMPQALNPHKLQQSRSLIMPWQKVGGPSYGQGCGRVPPRTLLFINLWMFMTRTLRPGDT